MKTPVALAPAPSISPTTGLSETFPAILRRAETPACFAADEFFSAQVSNPHTRRPYGRAVSRFLAWCDEQGIELRQVTPSLAGRFIQEHPGEVITKNQALAALRRFFNTLVTRHAVALNPFQSVRGRKHSVVDGKTEYRPDCCKISFKLLDQRRTPVASMTVSLLASLSTATLALIA